MPLLGELDQPTQIVPAELWLGMAVEQLQFHPGFDRVLGIGHAEVETGVAACLMLIFKLTFKVAVLLGKPEVGAKALPAFFPGTRYQRNDAVLQNPVACRFGFDLGKFSRAGDGDPLRFSWLLLTLSRRRRAEGQGQNEGDEKSAESCVMVAVHITDDMDTIFWGIFYLSP